MLKRSSQIRYQLEQMVDAIIAALAFTLALACRHWLTNWREDIFPAFDPFWNHAWLYMLLVPLWIFLLDFVGFYQHRVVRSSGAMLRKLTQGNVFGVMAAFFILYVLKIKQIPRILILLYSLWDIVIMWVKVVTTGYFERIWTRTSNILFVGKPEDLAETATRLRQMPAWKVSLLGLLLPTGSGEQPASATADEVRRVLGPMPVLGTVANLADVLHAHSVDYVLLSPGHQHFDEIQKTIDICETEGVEIWLAAAFVRTSIARVQVDEFQDLPMLVFSSTPAHSWALLLKRTIDFLGALVLVILFSPLMLLAAAAIKLTSAGPVLFKQKRCTLHGRPFDMYKFRTMISEAENQRYELENQNEMAGPVFKIRNDPRVTRVGRILRRHSLDELPQLFNVLKGEMSLVGPRPPIPAEVARYENWQRRRLSMRAGLTCLWQISGRNEVDFNDWMQMDLHYIDHWSLGLDLEILIKTPLVMIRGTGF